MKYSCFVCGHMIDEDSTNMAFADFPEDFRCPICDSPKYMFKPETGETNTRERSEKTAYDQVSKYR